MSNLDAMRVDIPRVDRRTGRRWLRLAAREVLLALHQSRRRMARRIIRDGGHLRDQSCRSVADLPAPT